MLRARRPLPVLLALASVAVACASPQARVPQQAAGPDQSAPPAPKRITAAITGNPTILNFTLIGGGARGGVDGVEELVHAGMSSFDELGTLTPRIGEAVPSVDTGGWKLFPDGTMETTWRIRANAVWHDGTPVTAEDLLFTAQVGQDPEMSAFGHVGYAALDRLEAPDGRTVVARWKRPYISADTMFSKDFSPPLPRHLLEPAYQADKSTFLQQSYWNADYVGTGPYRVVDYVVSSHMVVEAFDRYVLGRPRIDQIVIRFIPDANTLLANILAGEIDLTMGFGISLDQGISARDAWRDGRLELAYKTWILIHPQMINPTPAVITDGSFRRALLHAIDRQEMVDSIQYGVVPIAHGPLNPAGPDFKDTEASMVRYDYDPRATARLLEGLGYTRGGSGFYQDARGERLQVEIRGGGTLDVTLKSMLAVADYWQRAGVATEATIVPVQRARDREYNATRPGFELTRTSSDTRFPLRVITREVPLPENDFVGSNNSRYANPEFDSMVDRFTTTVPKAERTAALRQIIRHLTEVVVPLPLFFDTEPALFATRLQNVAVVKGERASTAWNAHEWDVK